MTKEIERKFLLDKLPDTIKLIGLHLIEQNYLSTGEEESRIRKEVSGIKSFTSSEPRYTSTTKRGWGLIREEEEKEITREEYALLNERIQRNPIIKVRGYVRIDGLKIEVDKYLNPELKELLIAEIEFDTAQDAVDADLPSWLGKDVTDDKSYKNQNLWQKIQVDHEKTNHMEEDVSLDGGTEVVDSHYDNEDVFKKNREVAFTASMTTSSFTLEGVTTQGRFTLISSTTDKQSILLKAHNMVSFYHKVIIREWVNGEVINRYTISKD